ncbi:MAG: type II toxin-antitoxin system VapC family toxin [Nitrososphaerales archaeon]
MFIDANIFLEVQLGQSRSQECEEFLNKVDTGDLQAFTSDFVIDSIVVTMENRNVQNIKILRFLLALGGSKGLSIYNHTFTDRILAANTMLKSGLTFDDSMVTVAVKAVKAESVVSFDSHFDDLKGIKRVEPKDLI